MVRRGAFGLPSRRRPPGPSPSSTSRAHGCRVRRDDTSGLPGLGEHESGLPLLLQRPGERRRYSSGPFRRDAVPVRRQRRPDPRSSRYDGVYLEAQAFRGGGLHHEGEQRQGQAWTRAHAHGLRAVDAFEPGGDNGWVAVGNGRGQVLEPEEVQGDERPQEEDQPNARADRGQGEHALAGQPAPIHRPVGRPARCVHICDREGDIWELFCLARELDTHFLIRRCSNRFAGDGSDTVESIMAEEKVRGLHSVAVRDDKGKLGSTQVEISYRRITIRPPIAKRKRYPALVLTVLHAREPEEPVGRPRIDWKLITDLPVDSHADAVEKLQWYAMRWKIEVFHKILKSGCRAEQARLRTAERLVRLLAVFCILSWRVFWLTMLNRTKPDLEAALVLTELETNILDRLIPDPTADPSPARTLSLYLIKIARLGGYLARAKDPPPGNIVMWRGLSRLNDIALGATLQINNVGN